MMILAHRAMGDPPTISRSGSLRFGLRFQLSDPLVFTPHILSRACVSLDIATMESLLAEISAKRKTISDSAPDGAAKKYMRRADYEKAKDEEERLKKLEASASRNDSRASKMRKEVGTVHSREGTLLIELPRRSKLDSDPSHASRTLRHRGGIPRNLPSSSSPSKPSIYPLTSVCAVCVPKRSPFVCSGRPTRSVDYDYALSSCWRNEGGRRGRV